MRPSRWAGRSASFFKFVKREGWGGVSEKEVLAAHGAGRIFALGGGKIFPTKTCQRRWWHHTYRSPTVRDAEMTIKIIFERSSQKGGWQGVRKEGQQGTHLEILLLA